MNLVLDANVFASVCNTNLKAYKFMNYILDDDNIYIVIDNEKEILKEYQKFLDENRFLYIWFMEMNQRKKFGKYSKKLHKKVHKNLTDLSFHPKDFKFVGVAIQSKSKYIVIEADSSNWEKVREFLSGFYKISIVDCESCLKILNNN